MRRAFAVLIFCLGVFVQSSVWAMSSPDSAAQQAVEPQSQEPPPIVYDIKTISEVPDGSRLEKGEFLSKTRFFGNENFAENQELVFRLRLPQNWTQTFNEDNYSDKINFDILTDIGRYFGNPIYTSRPFVSVQAIQLREELFAEDWFKSIALLSGFNLRAMKTNSYRDVEALYSSLEGDEAFAIHARVIVSGNVLFFIRVGVPVQVYDNFADYLAYMAGSFELRKPNWGAIEKLNNFSFLNAGVFYFPISWKVKNVNFSILDRLSLELYRVDSRRQSISGQIFVRAVKKKQGVSLQSELMAIRDDVKAKEWVLKKLVERTRVVPPQNFSGGIVEVYDIDVQRRQSTDQELWFSFLETQSHYFIISMYTPMREIAFSEWAKNKAVFYLILRNFELHQD